MPENTGQASKPEESKPVERPSTSPEEHEGKAGGRRFVKYQDLSKEDLVRMLMRINKRLSRISRELREVTDILYYGYTQGAPQSEGQENQGYRNYRRNYSGNRQYGYKGSYGRQRRSDEDDVNYD